METNQQQNMQNPMGEEAASFLTVSVGRQLGSGGRDIAKIVSQRLGCRFFDREILNLAAKESGFSAECFANNDENKGFLKSFFHIHAQHLGDTNLYNNSFSQESLFKMQSDAMRKAASEGSCLFVGRCSDYVLRDFPCLVSIFITADMTDRVARVMQRHCCDEAAAKKLISNGEATRSRYYNYYSGKRWGDCASYDFSINSSRFGIEGTAELIIDMIGKMK